MGVEVEDDEGALVEAVGKGVEGRGDELGPHGAAGDEASGGGRRRRRSGGGREPGVEEAEAVLVLHVLVTNLVDGGVSGAKVVEMDGDDAFFDSPGLNRPHVAEHLEVAAD